MAGKVVFVFPGQGSYDVELLRRLYATRRGLRPLFYAADQAAGDILGETFLPMVLGDGTRQSSSRDLDQLGIYLAGVATAQLWIERGLLPDGLLGHSFGELAAFATAGLFSFDDGARMVCQRVLSLREGAAAGRMAAVSTGAARVQAMLSQFAVASVISVINHPDQTVVSGPESELADLRLRFAGQAVSVTQLQSQYPFHSPLLAGASRAFRIALRGHRFAHPRYPVMVGTDQTWVGSETDVPDVMARQLVTPLNFDALVQRCASAGYSRFVECGAGTVVTKIIGRVLRSNPVLHDAWATFPVPSDVNERLAEIERRMSGAPEPAHARPTPTAIAPVTSPSVATTPIPATEVADAPALTEPIAIVGMGCVLPGGADSPEQFWKNIAAGISGIVDLAASVPHAREDFVGGDATGPVPKVVSDKTYTLLNGSVVRVQFDAALLSGRYSEEEFAGLTKGQQMLATSMAQADASVTQPTDRSRVQCILGSTADGVAELDEAHFSSSVREALGQVDVTASDARGFSRALGGGLPGWQRNPDDFKPHDLYAAVATRCAGVSAEQTYLVDSACSSSLYSLALGARALRTGDADMVYAGGVFAPGPANNNLFAQFRGLTPNESRPFDAKADGVVFGDGAGVVVLKRLTDALDSGDTIVAVVRSEGFSSDGKSPSINVPQAEGQAAAVQVAYTRAALDTRSIQYIEAHATATPVGDAVEFKALRRAFPSTNQTERMLGSVKSLIGHTGWTSGVASVIKICKSLEHQTIPRQFGYSSPNAQIDVADSGFIINVTDARWADNHGGIPRRAAVNSFGFGGTNAHVVLEEYRESYHRQVAASFRGRSAAVPDVVIVAAEGLFPENGVAFDRRQFRMPKKRMVLPDVAEHMDATQYLATMAAELVAGNMPADTLRNGAVRIGVALGLEAKTERGVRANERVFLDRLGRIVKASKSANRVYLGVRQQILATVIPSGPYTLPGLMPNVAASRITHTFDWHGPNIVVDRGVASLPEAIRIGMKFVQAGDCEVVLAGGVHAWVGHERQDQEGVALLAIATADTAAKFKLPVLARIECGQPSPHAVQVALDDGGRRRAATGAQQLLTAVREVGQRSTEMALTWKGHTIMTLVPPDRPRVAVQPPTVAQPAAPGAGSHAYVQGTPITSYSPLLVETVALPPSELSGRAYLFLIDQAEAWHSVEQSGVLRGLTYVVATPAGIGIPAAYEIDVSTEEALREGVSQLKSVAFDTIVAVKQLTGSADDELLSGSFSRTRALLDVLFGVARDRYDDIAQRRCSLATVCVGAVQDGILSPYTGLFAGFIKSLARELPDANCKAVATDEVDVGQALLRVAAELEAHDRIAEVAYQQTTRWRYVLTKSEPLHREGAPWLGPGAVVLATGGGRGVTAVLAEYLVEHGCTVVALGRTDPADLPDDLRSMDEAAFQAHESRFYVDERARDSSRKMPELKRLYERYQASNELASVIRRTSSASGKYEYVRCDINSRESIDAVIDGVLSRHGRLDMVMHGAGVQVSKALPRKTLSDFQRIVTTKLASLGHIYQACQTRGLEHLHFHLLTSAFSYFGNDGQPDYGAANEAMNRLADRLNRKNPKAHWSSFAWLGWAGIGMTRGSEYAALAANRRLRGVTRDEGQQLFADVIAGPPAAATTVIVADGEAAFYRPEFDAPPVLAPAPPAPSPALTETTEWIVGPETMPFLSDHLVRGVPTVPGAFLIAMAGDAALKRCPHLKIQQFERTRFLRLVRAHGDCPATVRTMATVVESGADETVVQVQIVMDFIHKTGRVLGENLLHTEIYVRMADAVRPPTGLALVPLRGQETCLPDPYVMAGSPVQLDGAFRAMQEVGVSEVERRAHYQLPEATRHASAFDHLIPRIIMVDAFWRFGTVRVCESGGLGVYVPERCDVMRVYFDYDQHGPDALRGPITFSGANPRAEGDVLHVGPITAFNADGHALLRVEGGLCRKFGEVEWP